VDGLSTMVIDGTQLKLYVWYERSKMPTKHPTLQQLD